jgi:geranylgeranyl pyrophosphate synthase
MTQSVWSSCEVRAAGGARRFEAPLIELIQAQFAEQQLANCLDLHEQRVPERLWNASLSGPLVELLSRPGKAFRSRLVEVAYAVGLEQAAPARPMPAELPLLVELLHVGSLIVDDIEDDSAERRGGPALHRVVGLPLALNAGNWLYFLPHSVIEGLGLAPGVELELRRAIDRGVLRCHYGQALDLGARLGGLSQREVSDVVAASTRLKTGSLMELSAELGAIAARAPAQLCAELARFGRAYGVALQMLDDASGLYDPRRRHKGHEDLQLGRPTWPWAWLAQRLDELSYSRLQHRARAVERGEQPVEELASALRRELGDAPYRAIHHQLWAAFERLEQQVASRSSLDPLAQEIERLEQAYG